MPVSSRTSTSTSSLVLAILLALVLRRSGSAVSFCFLLRRVLVHGRVPDGREKASACEALNLGKAAT